MMDGGASIDPKVAKYLLRQVNQGTRKQAPLKKPLSDREMEILTLLAEGKVRKEISEDLRITVNTVAYHVDHIYQKLNVMNAPAAVDAAYKSGILPVDGDSR